MDYGKDSKCSWILNTESPGYLVKVTFNDFELQFDEPASINRCPYDSLEFHDGRGYTPNLLGKYCGNLHPEVLYSTGEEMYAEFQSDSSRTYRGFNISILAVEVGMKTIYILPWQFILFLLRQNFPIVVQIKLSKKLNGRTPNLKFTNV